MKTADLHALLTQYGNKPIAEIIEIQGRPYKCPKCDGKGYTRESYNAYPSGFPDSGWVIDLQYKNVDCKLCDSHGYTQKELKPVIKTEIIGYE
jgi:predicted nucleic-acid-binding Zn-ribbon protein